MYLHVHRNAARSTTLVFTCTLHFTGKAEKNFEMLKRDHVAGDSRGTCSFRTDRLRPLSTSGVRICVSPLVGCVPRIGTRAFTRSSFFFLLFFFPHDDLIRVERSSAHSIPRSHFLFCRANKKLLELESKISFCAFTIAVSFRSSLDQLLNSMSMREIKDNELFRCETHKRINLSR